MGFSLRELGLNIRRLRENRPSQVKPGRSMLQYELARKAGIPASCLSNLEKGKYRNPTWQLLTKLAQALECDIPDFFSRDREERSPSLLAFEEMISLLVKEKVEKILKEKVTT
ncbi:MAG: helix-turn-helix domain-containing protein [Candidatus Aminicenantales bacterium]